MRCFIAIDIDDRLRGEIEKLQSQFRKRLKNQAGIKWVRPELIHLTLKFLGEVEDGRAEEIGQAIELVCAAHKSFELEFSTVGTFGRPAKVLWLGGKKQNTELEKLVQDIEETFEELDFEKEQRPFSPHLTLARIRDDRSGKQTAELADNFGPVNAGTIKVDAVCFYKSQLTSDGPVYTLLRKINFM
ncbi:MAG: RNA 2',3'-cyclic phosphodiesterase [Phycisphaerae bacterium]|jgi:2'-5' RNA ligase